MLMIAFPNFFQSLIDFFNILRCAHELEPVQDRHPAFLGDDVCCYTEQAPEVRVPRPDNPEQVLTVSGLVEEFHDLRRDVPRTIRFPVGGCAQHVWFFHE